MERFTDKGGGTVKDNKAGLVWAQDASLITKRSWQDAIDACKKLNKGGHEWRLPTIDELCTLIDRSQHDPALPQGHPFVNVQSNNYWSASGYVPDPHRAWIADMYNGNVYNVNKSHDYYVWPVRPDN